MRVPRFTNSKDGTPRMTVGIGFRIDRYELTIALGEVLDKDFNLPWGKPVPEDTIDHITRTDVYKKLRFILWDMGTTGIEHRSENWSFPERIMTYAEEHIEKLFPELKEIKG